MSIKTGSNRRAADGQRLKSRENLGEPVQIGIKHRHISGEFLTEGQGSGILEMSAPDLHNVGIFAGLGIKGFAKLLDRREKSLANHRHCRDVHCGGEGIVGGL